MTNPLLRYSPSGGIVQNAEGAPLAPGAGMMLRLAEGYTAIGGTLQITTTPQTLGTVLGGGTVLVETLADPSPDLRYRASLSIDVMNNSTSTGADVVLFIDSSVDGVNWVEQVNNAHAVGAGSGPDGDEYTGKHCRLDMTMRLGSALGGGMAAGAPSLRVRGRIAVVAEVTGAEVDSRGSTGPYDDFVGTCLLQLSEHF
jgi:hypothetical protein